MAKLTVNKASGYCITAGNNVNAAGGSPADATTYYFPFLAGPTGFLTAARCFSCSNSCSWYHKNMFCFCIYYSNSNFRVCYLSTTGKRR